MPLTGYRLTWQSKTFMKIEMRRARSHKKAGSSVSTTLTTLPSAGATTMCSPVLQARSGSRKKATTQAESATQTAATIHQVTEPLRTATISRASAIAHAPAMNQRPSGAVRITTSLPARAP